MKVLGLDLGIGSIGWALIETDDKAKPKDLLGMGSRIINLSPDEKSSFANGKGETVCSQRTSMRTARKCLDRYQMRRNFLQTELKKLGMFDSEKTLLELDPLATWQLRANAATPGHKLTLKEIGRVLLHINQKRGYRHAKDDSNDASQRDYVAKINQRYSNLKEKGVTVGQYFASELKKSELSTSKGGHCYTYRIKENVLPRQAYKEEVEQILNVQSKFYPEVLSANVVKKLIDTIFFQRPLKSCKHLVSICEFETRQFLDHNGKQVNVGPKVAPRTSPLAQLTRIYEAVNNIVLVNYANKQSKTNKQSSLFDEFEIKSKDARLMLFEYELNQEERLRVVDYLLKGEKLTETALLKILGLKKADGFRWEGAPKNGMPGDTTYSTLKEAVANVPDAEETLLRFNVETGYGELKDVRTGEILPQIKMTEGCNGGNPEPMYLKEPLYKLWHTVYSSSTREELSKAMEKVFGITEEKVIDNLYKIDFVKPGYSNRSSKFMRKILPLLMNGMKYSEACSAIGVNHSNSITKEENGVRELVDCLPNLQKGVLRQPVIEKILNQMINVVNSIKEQFGEIDEIRVELARELKQSKDQRAKATIDIASRERENTKISKILEENGIRSSRRNIQKYRLWEETGKRCIYCGRVLSLNEYFDSGEGEIEHIIPRSLFFDDSISNKACSCRNCNKAKSQMTAYDYMMSKGELEFNQYLSRVDQLYKDKKISKTKLSRFTTAKEEIPTDFLDRDMRQTQYISKKAIEILRTTCRNVYASSGAVTDFLRHAWGYDMILHNLNIRRYEKADLVKEVEIKHGDHKYKEFRIKGWSKRLDHRHHAIDALVIALTRQGYIQRLNNLNSERDLMTMELEHSRDEYDRKFHLLEQWSKERPHFPVDQVADAVDKIAVSIKSGKKLATPGKRYIRRNGQRIKVQEGLVIPRGSLHQDTVYGQIKVVKHNVNVKESFASPEKIVNHRIKAAVEDRIRLFNNDIEKAKKSLTKSPLKIILKGKEIEINTVDVYEELYATRKSIDSLTKPAIEKIIDPVVKHVVKRRLAEYGGDEKKFKQSLEEKPITIGQLNRPVKSVRLWSNDKMIAVRKDASGKGIGFAMPGNNHHVAFYEYEGKVLSLTLQFANAIKRIKLGIPSIVKAPDEAWQVLENLPDTNDIREVAQNLPPYGSRFIRSLKMGDMFILGLSEEDAYDAFENQDMKVLSSHLYRVQKVSLNDYNFRLHTWTSVDAKNVVADTNMGAYLRIGSYGTLMKQNPIPVNVNNLGQIIRKDD